MSPLVPIVVLVAVGLLVYWQLIIAEGAYLGPRVVAFLYDVVARRYNRIKKFNPDDDASFVSNPLVEWLSSVKQPRVLDVATGSGRLPLSLVAHKDFDGTIVAVDLARRMLGEAARALSDHLERVSLMRQDASRLAFANDVFDAVTCLEALEFVPDPRAALAECVRVLRPGGVLLVTRRTGRWAGWMPGRTLSSEKFKAQVEESGIWDVRARIWQIDYDLVWGVKIAQWDENDEGRTTKDE